MNLNRRVSMTTFVYQLKDGNETVYYGTTDDLERREKQHQREGKIFDSIESLSEHETEEEAKEIERRRLLVYHQRHGRYPRYNKDPNG